MRIRINRPSNLQGSALVIALVICGILGLLLGSYLYMVNTQNLSVARARAWEAAIPVAEAGIEEALAHLNTPGMNSSAYASDSWVDAGNGNFTKTTYLGTSYSAVTIQTASNTSPVIVAAAYVPGPIGTPVLTRTVQVRTRAKSAATIPGAMVVQTTVDLKGNGISTDSFISTNSLYSSNGFYVPYRARDHGDVSTTSTATNAVNLGVSSIKGSVHTGYGGDVDAVNASVGDMNWVTNGNKGIQTGHEIHDASYTFADVPDPSTVEQYWFTPVPGKYVINGVTYKYLLNDSFPWKLSVLDGSVYCIGQHVKLWITDNVNLGSKDAIRLDQNGYMDMYVGVADCTIGGQGVINDTGQAWKFNYWGLPSNTSLNFGANATFTGRIYAPSADFTLGGGGNNTYDFIGQSITRSVKMNGHFNFHFDEAYPIQALASGCVATSWDEL